MRYSVNYSPLWIDETVGDLEVACRRLLWAKLINLGQTCVAPDYVITTSKCQTLFIGTAIKILNEFCGSDPQKSMGLSRFVNERNFNRVHTLLSATQGMKSLVLNVI
jgi:aldehyde dehydrogenase (NAD+)